MEESLIFHCTKCGHCLSVCPTYRESLIETDSPRGRVILARKAFEGFLPLGKRLAFQLEKCLHCLACTSACPADIKPSEILMNVKHQIALYKKKVFSILFCFFSFLLQKN